MLNAALIHLYGVENSGVRAISSVLKRGGVNTHIIFFKKWVNNDIRMPSKKEVDILISLLKQLDIGLVGIGFTSPFLKIAQGITENIKSSLGVTVAWGGIHATVKPEECLKYADVVCRGEGEYAMLELAKALANSASFSGIKNISYRRENKIVSQEISPLIDDLDSLPHYDFDSDNKFFIDNGLQSIDPLVNARELRVFASRGCPFSCSYCYNSIFTKLYGKGKYHRIKSPEKTISEIEYALGKFKKINRIKFDDDTFVFPAPWIDEFCRKYKSRVGIPFEILLNAECANDDAIKQLRRAGLKRVQVGVQTGSANESKEVYNRELAAVKIRKFACFAAGLKLGVVYDIILDNPLAGPEDKKALIGLLLSLPRPFNLFVYSLTVFPGTGICDLFLERGLITEKDIEGAANKSFYQFRLSFAYPRSREELFTACIVSLIPKDFIPKRLIYLLEENNFLKAHPLPLKLFAQFCNLLKLFFIFMQMLIRGELSIRKISEYIMPKRLPIQ